MRNSILSALVIATAVAVGLAATARPAVAQSQGGGYVVCFVSGPGGQYFSAPFPASDKTIGEERGNWNVAFGKFVQQKYGQSGNQACVPYGPLAQAQAALKRATDLANAQHKVVLTEWTPATPPLEVPQTTGMLGLCFSDPGQSPVYYSGEIHVDFEAAQQLGKGATDPRVADLINKSQTQFLAFLQKTYGYRNQTSYPTSCQFNMKSGSEVTALKERFTSRFPQVKYIETGWLPGTSPAAAMPANTGQPAAALASIAGVYTGTYLCGGRTRSLKLQLTGPENGLITAHFTAYVPPESHDKPYTFTANGHFDPATGKFRLMPLKWDTPAPPNIVMVGMTGTFDAKTNRVTGTIDYTGCTTFEAMRGRDD